MASALIVWLRGPARLVQATRCERTPANCLEWRAPSRCGRSLTWRKRPFRGELGRFSA